MNPENPQMAHYAEVAAGLGAPPHSWEVMDENNTGTRADPASTATLKNRETGAVLYAVPARGWEAWARYADIMAEHYLIAAHWTDGGPDNPEIEEAEFSTEARHQASRDCALFLCRAFPLLEKAWHAEQAGHDLWLTRNGHGAGFWDRHPLPHCDSLSDLAEAMGSRDLYVGDDGLLYFL